jgi:hypothetical protein
MGLARRESRGLDGPCHAAPATVVAMDKGHPAACNRWRGVLAAASLLLALAMLGGCSRPDPEAALREAVASLHASIERRDPAAMQQHLAADFIGNEGLDREGARRLAAMLVLRHRELAVDTGPLDVRLSGEHAVVRFTALLRGGAGGLLPDAARVYDVETGWRLEHGTWRLASARWTPAVP